MGLSTIFPISAIKFYSNIIKTKTTINARFGLPFIGFRDVFFFHCITFRLQFDCINHILLFIDFMSAFGQKRKWKKTLYLSHDLKLNRFDTIHFRIRIIETNFQTKCPKYYRWMKIVFSFTKFNGCPMHSDWNEIAYYGIRYGGDCSRYFWKHKPHTSENFVIIFHLICFFPTAHCRCFSFDSVL